METAALVGAAVIRISGCDRRPGSLRDFRNCLRKSCWLVLQRQIGLRDDADDAVFGIHNGNSPHLVLPHQALAGLDIFAITARERSQREEFFDWRGSRIHAFRDDGAA